MPHAIYEDPDHIGFYKVIWVSEEDYKIIQDREEKERARRGEHE